MQTVTVNSEFKPMRKFVKLIFYLNASLNAIDKKNVARNKYREGWWRRR